MPKPSEAPQFGPILRARIQWVKKAVGTSLSVWRSFGDRLLLLPMPSACRNVDDDFALADHGSTGSGQILTGVP
jgi:hypothetical protein